MELRNLIESKDFLEESIDESIITITNINKDDLEYIFRNINTNVNEKLEDDAERCKFMLYKHKTNTNRYIQNVYLLIKQLLKYDKNIFIDLSEEHIIQIFVYLNYQKEYHYESIEFIKLFEHDINWLKKFLIKDTLKHSKLYLFHIDINVDTYLLIKAMQYDSILYEIDHYDIGTLLKSDQILNKLHNIAKLNKRNKLFQKRIKLLIKLIDKSYKRSNVGTTGNLEYYQQEIECFDSLNPPTTKNTNNYIMLNSIIDYETIVSL